MYNFVKFIIQQDSIPVDVNTGGKRVRSYISSDDHHMSVAGGGEG